MNNKKGFTLIELMAVVAILSIVAVVALSAYSDYLTRSKVSEGLAFAAEAKTSISEYFYQNKRMPQNNSQAGLPAADSYDQHDYTRKLELSSSPPYGVINITFKILGSKADNKELQLIPSTTDEVVSWTCKPAAVNGIDTNHVPPNCRG